ncbi:hypothetical protein MCAV_04130 [[Mycoplasma] cavipharyngis]|uniref:hypothetical protein n=1 Tax=[Mycoplasma] cavipharyngis TaxID=92757 RepID=UPI0037044687
MNQNDNNHNEQLFKQMLNQTSKKYYDIHDLDLMFKNDLTNNAYQNVISIKNNWRLYAERFEEIAASLPTSSNLYGINSVEFLKNSKIYPIFSMQNWPEHKISKINSHVQGPLLRYSNLEVSTLSKVLCLTKKENIGVRFQSINNQIVVDQMTNHHSLIKSRAKPLTYYVDLPLTIQSIKGSKNN